jgi:hypothetical protein
LLKNRPGLAGSKRILFLVARSAVYEMPPLFRLSLDQPLIQAFLPEWPPFLILIPNRMKRIFFLAMAILTIIISITSCAPGRSMKRDCQGGKHVRLKNGIYI